MGFETVNAPPESHGKTWKAGTLTYTSAGLAILFFWLLWGDFAWSLKERSVGPVVQLLFKKFGASNMLVGLLVGSLPQIIGMIFTPIISYRSDRHRGRWGRRIPFLLIPTPIAALSMIALALSPALGVWVHHLLGAHSPGLNTVVLIFFGVFWTLFEFASIAANAVFGALINDVVPRPLLGRFFGLFRALSLIAGMVFNYWLMGKAEVYYVWMFAGIGALYGGGVSLMCTRVKEGGYPSPPAIPATQCAGFFGATKTYFKECYSNPYYLCFFAMAAFGSMAAASVNLFNVFFAKSVNMSLDQYGKYVALTYFISLVMTYPLGWLADRFHPFRMALGVHVLYILITLWSGLFATDTSTYTIALVATGVIAGCGMTVGASIQQHLFPRSRFAQFHSAAGLVVHVGAILVGPIVGRIIDLSDHVYRYSYLAASCLSILGLIMGLMVYRKFMALGGPRNYIAPE